MEVINPPGTLICPLCGHFNDERAFFCSNCGATIGSKAGRAGSRRTDYQSYHNYASTDRGGYYFDGLPLISLVVSIFGLFVVGFIGPLIGVVLAHVSLRRMKRSGIDHNHGLVVTSLVVGYFLLAVGLLFLVVLGVFVGAAFFNHGWADGHWNYL